MTHPDFCAERVYSGARIDMFGHQCMRKHIEGSVYCRQHHDKHNPKALLPADQKADPTVEAQATLYATVHWEENQGPVLVDLGRRYFVRRVEITLSTRRADAETYLKWSGAAVKKDGTEGQNWVTGRYTNRLDFAGHALSAIDRQIAWLEDVAEMLRFKMDVGG